MLDPFRDMGVAFLLEVGSSRFIRSLYPVCLAVGEDFYAENNGKDSPEKS